MFKLPKNHLDDGSEDKFTVDAFMLSNRAICPRCGNYMIRRAKDGKHHFECCRRIWEK